MSSKNQTHLEVVGDFFHRFLSAGRSSARARPLAGELGARLAQQHNSLGRVAPTQRTGRGGGRGRREVKHGGISVSIEGGKS